MFEMVIKQIEHWPGRTKAFLFAWFWQLNWAIISPCWNYVMVVSQSFISSSICAQITAAYYILLWVIKMLINKSTLPQFQERSTLLNGSPFWCLSCSKHNTSTEIHINSLLLKSTTFTFCTASLRVPGLHSWFPSGFLTFSPYTHQPILKVKSLCHG